MKYLLCATFFAILSISIFASEFPLYCIIDLSGGPSASSYPVSYSNNIPLEGWSDTYKSERLVLRRIDPGSFLMSDKCEVTLTKPYYIGIFEITQKQYELVIGSNPSYFTGESRPVANMSYNSLLANDGFMSRLGSKIGRKVNLPTEAQWEYACRAGSTTAYPYGGIEDEDLQPYARFSNTKYDGKGGYDNAPTNVGLYEPNAWGLYDMHGNVWEFCSDWYTNELATSEIDPVGPETGTYHVTRGGDYRCAAWKCASNARWDTGCDEDSVDGWSKGKGFRIVTDVYRQVVARSSACEKDADIQSVESSRSSLARV